MSRGARTCIKCQPQRPRGPESPRWRGGGKPRQYGPRGYIYAKAPGHPRGARNYGYVFEHILVMEKMLGRYLLPTEQVHHRNGRRDDNRPENLELWVRGQPNGTRVEDAIAWAREILARYTNDPPPGGGGSL
jgi:HNH endonuclease